MARPPFVGRVDEIARASSIAGGDHAATLVLLGPPGIGKTALLEAVRRRLEQAGLSVERVLASTAGRDLPLAPFARFVDPPPGAQDLAALVVQVVNTLRAAGMREPTVLMVDDAHRLDDASTVVVSQLAHGDEVRVVLAARSTEPLPSELEHLVDGPDVEVIEVRPLRRDETDDMVRADLAMREPARRGPFVPADVSGEVLDEIWRWSLGVPFHVRDLLDSSVESGALVLGSDLRWVQREPLTPSSRFADALSRRVELLGPACDRLVRALAVAGPLPVRMADTITPPLDRLAAERSGILRRRADDPDGETVTFAHDLYREAAASWLSPGERHRIAAGIADRLGEADETTPDEDLLRAELSLQAGALGTADAAVYERGAEVACHIHYDGARGLRLADAALARGAGTRAELVRLAALGLLHRVEEADRGYAELERRVQDPTEIAMVGSARAWHLLFFVGDVDAAVDVLDAAAQRVPEPLAEQLRGQQVTALFFAGRPAEAVEAGSRWVEDPAGLPPTMAFGLVSGLVVTGRAEDAVRVSEPTLRRAAADPAGDIVVINMVWNRLLGMWQLGRLGELADPFGGLPPLDHPHMSSEWMRSGMIASFEHLRGHLARSEQVYDSVWDLLVLGPPQIVGLNTILRATGLAQLGRVDEATDLLAFLDDVAAGPLTPTRWWSARARVLTMAAQGAVTDAIRRSLELADEHAGEHLYVTTSLHDVVRFGRAKFVKERLAAQARRPHATWWDRLCAEHAAAAAPEQPDAGRLLQLADRFERSGRSVEALELAAHTIAVADDVAAPREAKLLGVAAATKVEALRDECGEVRTPLLVAAPRPLTEREFLVARLAAAGRSNAEIAQRLGTSVRTVGNQLQSVYQKLGLHSRDQLRTLVE